MANPFGWRGRTAYNPKAVVAFLDSKRAWGILNGIPLDRDTDGRTIRRWRSGEVKEISPKGLQTIFRRYNLYMAQFEDWCRSNNRKPRLRG